VRGRVQVARDHHAAATGSIVEEGEVDSNVEVDFVAMLAAMRSGRRRECALSARKNRAIGGWKDGA
jgi:hypothetical protein